MGLSTIYTNTEVKEFKYYGNTNIQGRKDFELMMFSVALFTCVAECRVALDLSGPMVVCPQPQSGVCQANLANSSPDDCSLAKLSLAPLTNFTKDDGQFSLF